MRYLAMIVLLVSLSVTANPYKEYLRADEDERFEMLWGERADERVTYWEFMQNLQYATPTACNSLIPVDAYFKLSQEWGNERADEVSDKYIFFKSCDFQSYLKSKFAKKHYHAGIVYNDGKAFILRNYHKEKSSFDYFYLIANRANENEIKAMTQSAGRYSVVLYTQSEPTVRVY